MVGQQAAPGDAEFLVLAAGARPLPLLCPALLCLCRRRRRCIRCRLIAFLAFLCVLTFRRVCRPRLGGRSGDVVGRNEVVKQPTVELLWMKERCVSTVRLRMPRDDGGCLVVSRCK